MADDEPGRFCDLLLDDLVTERRGLYAILKRSAEPVLLDIKPGPLTPGEREMFESRLRIVEAAIQAWL